MYCYIEFNCLTLHVSLTFYLRQSSYPNDIKKIYTLTTLGMLFSIYRYKAVKSVKQCN